MTRADARRNRRSILDAGRAQIVEHGVEVPMEQIAKAAGVAVGTLYRHFPSKSDLVAAILAEISESALERAEQAIGHIEHPHEAAATIERLFTDLTEEAATNRAIKAAAAVLGAPHWTEEQGMRGYEALQTLIARAQADGDLRPSISASDLFLIISTAPIGIPSEARRRWLEIMLAGIRTR